MFLIGKPTISQSGSIIRIRDIRAKLLMSDIARIWKTQRINSNMFEEIGRTSISFEAFFALEMHYILESIIENRRIISNVRALRAIVDQLEEKTWLRFLNAPVSRRVDLKRLDEITLTLYPYQMEFIEKYDAQTQRYSLKGMLLGTLPGSGKTATTLALAHALNSRRVIIICPKIAVERVWEKTIQTLFKEKQTYWYYYSGKKYNKERFAIFHYEALGKALEMLPELLSQDITIILDESHNLTEMATLRTQLFLDFCKNIGSRDIILASGTPIKAITSEIVPLFHAIDDLFNENVAARFQAIYRGDANRATEILTHRIDQVSFKIEKEELNLPAPIFRNMPIKIPNGGNYTLEAIGKDLVTYAASQVEFYAKCKPENEKKFYDYLAQAEAILLSPTQSRSELRSATDKNALYHRRLEQVIFCSKRNRLQDAKDAIIYCNQYEKNTILSVLKSKDDRDEFKDLKTIIKYVNLKIRGECLGRVLGRKRIEAHIEMTPYIDFETILNSTEKKTVVFTSYIEVLEKAKETITKIGGEPIAVYGAVNKDLSSLISKFEKDPNANPLIATYASLSTAMPLIMADVMVIINAPFRNYVFEQAVSRIQRLGADTQTCIYLCFLDTGEEPNISSRSVDILKWSQDQVEKILGVDSTFKIEDVANNKNMDDQAISYLSAVVEELQILELKKEEHGFSDIAIEQTVILPIWKKW